MGDAGPSFRVRPLIPESAVTDVEMVELLDISEGGALSASSREIVAHWCRLDDIGRRVAAMKTVMFRIIDSNGAALEPALSAEEQFLIDEVGLTMDPAAASAVVRLLCIPERNILIRTLKRFLTEMVKP